MSFTLFACKKEQIHDDKPFNEEFVNVTTSLDYFRFEWNAFGDEIYYDIPEGLSPEKLNERDELYGSTTLYTNPEIYKNSKKLVFKNRNYYCAFYGEAPERLKNKKINNHQCLGLFYYESDDDAYTNHVRFKNYYSLNEISYTYDGFYLYNLIQLIDVFDGDNKIATTFRFQYYLLNDDDRVCYYDIEDSYSDNYLPYDSSHEYFAYYDEEQFKDKTIIPYFYRPYGRSCLMGSRVEVDSKYAYFPYYEKIESALSTLADGTSREIHGEVLKKKRKVKDYDITEQNNVTKEVEDVYYRVPLEELKIS